MNNFWGFTENPSFRGGLGKKQGSGVFEGWRGGGGDTPMHTKY